MTQEIWKDIEGTDGKYQVSNLGRVKSIQGKREGFIKPEINIGGYLTVHLRVNHKNLNRVVHRLMMKAFIPNPENKPFVNHKDGNKLNNSFENLEWCTASENRKHAYDTGLCKACPPIGEKNAQGKLKTEDVLSIRVLLKYTNLRDKQIGEIFNVSQVTISQIHRRQTWRHI